MSGNWYFLTSLQNLTGSLGAKLLCNSYGQHVHMSQYEFPLVCGGPPPLAPAVATVRGVPGKAHHLCG